MIVSLEFRVGEKPTGWSRRYSGKAAMHGTWLYAFPVPIFSALGGTLVGKWFGRYDDLAAGLQRIFASRLFS